MRDITNLDGDSMRKLTLPMSTGVLHVDPFGFLPVKVVHNGFPPKVEMLIPLEEVSMHITLQNVTEKGSGRGYTLTLMDDGLTLAQVVALSDTQSIPAEPNAVPVSDETVKRDAPDGIVPEPEKREPPIQSVRLAFREISRVSLEPGDPHELLIHSEKGEYGFVLVNNPHYMTHQLADLLKQAVHREQ